MLSLLPHLPAHALRRPLRVLARAGRLALVQLSAEGGQAGLERGLQRADEGVTQELEGFYTEAPDGLDGVGAEGG